MRRIAIISLAATLCVASSSFAQSTPFSAVDSPLAAVQNFDSAALQTEYKLGPLDKISVKVFGLEKFSVEKTQVDASGQIVLPLIGVVTAGGRTAQELSIEIAQKLGERYLQSPNVSVLIEEAVSQRVTVSGAVVESGVYTLKGPTTLMQALAMAKGVDPKTASLKRVAVFRNINGQRAGALFDLQSIRAGRSPDPAIQGGDSIVVQGSTGKIFWRELVTALPGFGIFAYL